MSGKRTSRQSMPVTAPNGAPHPLDFFSSLVWLDGRPLLDTIEPYRQRELVELLYTFRDDGFPRYNRALRGRAKKNYKSSDLTLACLYRFLAWPSAAGNACFIVANDEDQAADDLSLVKKLIEVNPILNEEVEVRSKEIKRRDGAGSLKILPAQDAVGSHGKSYLFLGYDEIWAYRNYDLIEALSPDPTRHDALVYFTSYAPIRFADGIPLYDLFHAGKRGDDPSYHFAWYGGDFTTDPEFDRPELTQEQRANPSMASWGNNDYLREQEKRLPRHRYRRLHLNLPGTPDGAAFDAGSVLDAIISGRRSAIIPDGARPVAAVDMSGGAHDDATLSIAYRALDQGPRRTNTHRIVLAHLSSQNGKPPFNPRSAVAKFARTLKEYHINTVVGDNYGGETFKRDFAEHNITYVPADHPKSFYYEWLDPKLNAGEVELLDIPRLQEQLLGLVWRGARIDHQSGIGDHDDYANSVAIAVWLAGADSRRLVVSEEMLNRAGPPRHFGRYQNGFRRVSDGEMRAMLTPRFGQ
ncbi:MAG TPA: hypothetical protein VHY35_05200 [Stellaceae bacterium]|jgi:phage terminase large subunit-like protein|nr:hypothetical protein [Stellaceae bacterium]